MTAGIDPGCVRLRLAVADDCVSRVAVTSERPAVAPRLRGQAADQAVRRIPLLFALCGKAQGRAAALALEAARGSQTAAHCDPLVQQEALREHLWRWLLDLPALLGAAPQQKEFVAAMGWLKGGERAALGAFLEGPEIESLCRLLGEAEDVIDGQPRCLPPLEAPGSLAFWPRFDADFCVHPDWQGAAAETGAIARRGELQAGSPAFARRWRARLAELRDWAVGAERVGAGGTASAVPVDTGRGRALVETARGLLMHEIVLDGERIADYFIVAPTEWNFHPQGPLAGWLAGRDASDRQGLQALVARAVAALDPCVRWELEWL